MEQYAIYVVTVIKDDGTTRKERFSDKENLEKWLKYMKETSSAITDDRDITLVIERVQILNVKNS